MGTKTKENLKGVYLKIENDGEIDINAFRLIGASSKRSDETKIGYFGSGLKYAIAVLLRNSVSIKVFSGLDEIKISTSNQKFRGQDFKVIKFNNKLTSLTTEMGIDWEPWFAIREVYCNALDEGSFNMTVEKKLEGVKGKTIFYIEFNEKIREILKNWNEYFSNKRTDSVYLDKDKVFIGGEKLVVYRKGIKVTEKPLTSLFHYDFDSIKINESRIVESDFELNWTIIQFLKEKANERIIREIYDNGINSYEGRMDWNYGVGYFNNSWLEVIGGRNIILEDSSGYFIEYLGPNSIILPNSLAKALKKYFKEKVHVLGYSDKYGEKHIIEFNSKQKMLLDECVDFIKDEIQVNDYKITLCNFKDKDQLGEAIDDTIFVSPKVFDLGKKQILATLIEEYAHLDSNAGDKTRRFQNYLINKFISSVEDKKKIYL